MMTWYWEGENMAPLGKMLCKKMKQQYQCQELLSEPVEQ